MIDIKWLPFVPNYPNVQIPIKKDLINVRVVEPSTRTSVKMNLQETSEERAERARQLQQNAAVLRYDKDGSRILSIANSHGYFIDISV